MKNKILITRASRYFFYALLCVVLSVGCTKRPEIITNTVIDTVYVEKIIYRERELKPKRIDNAVRAGQTWVYEYGLDNPYETPIIDTLYVLEVRDGYIKYKHYTGIRNRSLYWFKVGTRRIK